MKKVLSFIMLIIVLSSSIFTGCDESRKEGGSDKTDKTGGISSIIYHTVKFETNGGTSVSAKSIKTLTKAPSTTKSGYIFDGWFRDENLTVAVVYPLDIDNDMTLYARWVKKEDTINCTNGSIKFMDSSYDSTLSYNISPRGFDYDRLAELEATGMKITVTYTVYYRKDYDVWLDIGYAGSPKYEVAISNSKGVGQLKSDLSTSTSENTRTISVATTFDYFKNDSIFLTFGTNNIQNVIYIKNIKVEYECGKIN